MNYFPSNEKSNTSFPAPPPPQQRTLACSRRDTNKSLIQGVTVEVRGSDRRIRTAYYTHNDTRVSTATCSVAMAIELLAGNVRPGVWYPEEAYRNNPNVLRNALKNCHTYRESERVLSQREIPKRRQQQLPKEEEGGGEGETRKERERGRERKKERRRIAWAWRFVVGGAMIALLFIVLSWWLYE